MPHTHEQSGITREDELNSVAINVQASMKDANAAEAVSVDHSDESWVPKDGAERTFNTGISNIVTGIAFSLMLVAVYLLRGKTGEYEFRFTLGRSRFFNIFRISSIGSASGTTRNDCGSP